MLDPYPFLKHIFNQIEQRIPSLNTIEQKSFSLLKIIMSLFTLFFILIVTFDILDDEDNIVVQPFEIVGIGENLDGKALATLLSFDLQRIKNVYEPAPKITDNPKSDGGKIKVQRPLENFYITNFSFKKIHEAPLGYNIGTVGFEGTSISIGNLVLFIKESLGNKPNVITCSLQRYNSSMFVIATLEDRHSSAHKNDFLTFENEANISKYEQIPTLINDLAFMIALELSKRKDLNEDDLYPQTWQTFKYVTQGRNAYNNYVIIKNINHANKIDYLNKVRDMALLATISEPGYNGSFELLSGIGFAYLEMEKYDEAEKIFKTISGSRPFESALGLGLVYYNQDYHAEALNAFENATRLNPKNAAAWNCKGIILGKQGNYNEAVKAFKKTISLNSQYAMAWKYEGDALANLGKNNRSMYNESIKAYDEATSLDSNLAAAWYNKGYVLKLLGKTSESNAAFAKAKELVYTG